MGYAAPDVDKSRYNIARSGGDRLTAMLALAAEEERMPYWHLTWLRFIFKFQTTIPKTVIESDDIGHEGRVSVLLQVALRIHRILDEELVAKPE